MKGPLITILLLAAAVGGLWWYADQRNTRMAAEREAARLAAEQELRDARVTMFGEAAQDEAIVWSDSGLGIKHLVEGAGVQPLPGGYVKFNYVVYLADGTEVQRTEKATEARIGQMIPGMSSGLQQMKTGGKAMLFIPPKLGYGRSGYATIPPNAGLVFEIELLEP